MNHPIAQQPRQVTRRTLLRGAGVAMALPWLESIPVWGSQPTTGGDVAQAPKRFGVQFMACGVNPDHWWAKPSDNGLELGKSLQPMESLKHKLNFVSGLFNRSAVGVGIHPGQTGNILSGASLQKGAELRGGISIDQLIANHWGDATVQASLVLGCEQPVTGYHETNFSMAYSSHISWQNATSPVPMEVYPSLAFDSLFDNRGSRRNQSVLDRVQEHADSLVRQVSGSDKVKLDEYMTSVREVERQIQRMRDREARSRQQSAETGQSLASMSRPDNGLPEDIRQHMQLMCDIVALAFQTDRTRVATLLMCRDISGMFYPFLGVRHTHHSASHYDHDDDYEKITRYYVEQYAYLAGRLDSMQEGDRTVLDNSCLLFVNNMWSGSRHDSTKVPLLMAGGLGDTLQMGRVLDFEGQADDQRRLCGLYLGVAQRLGIELESFGDATEPLAVL